MLALEGHMLVVEVDNCPALVHETLRWLAHSVTEIRVRGWRSVRACSECYSNAELHRGGDEVQRSGDKVRRAVLQKRGLARVWRSLESSPD